MSKDLRNKMYDYEVIPPEKVWEKIAFILNEGVTEKEFSSKLYNLEAAPPVAAWENIRSSLDTEYETSAPRQRVLSPFYRYAIAALLIALIVFGGIKLLNNRSDENKVAKEKTISPVKDSFSLPNQEADSPTNKKVAVSDEVRDDEALENSKRTFAKLDDADRSRIKKIMTAPVKLISYVDEVRPGQLQYAGFNSSSPVTGETSEQLVDRYIMLMTPEGNLIRMAKKWGDLACCVTGEERDANCKDKLQQWREKIACSPLVPSPGNLLDILSLVNSIKDNNP